MAVSVKRESVIAERPYGGCIVRAEVVRYNGKEPRLNIARFKVTRSESGEVTEQYIGRPSLDWELLQWIQEQRIVERAVDALDSLP